MLLVTCVERKIWSNIQSSQKITTMIVERLIHFKYLMTLLTSMFRNEYKGVVWNNNNSVDLLDFRYDILNSFMISEIEINKIHTICWGQLSPCIT